MEEPKKKKLVLKKKYAIILVVALLSVFAVVAVSSYAFFTHSVTSEGYVVYASSLEIDFEEKSNVINIQNARPMTNTEGLATTPYSFDVKNTGALAVKYRVRLELDNGNTLPLEYVKISVYKNDTEYLKPTKLSNLNSNLVIVDNAVLNGVVDNTISKDNYKVRLWVDINASNDMIGKTFGAKIVVDAMQNVDDGFAANTKPVIVLNKDANGNTDLLLNLNDTYTELGVSEVKDDKDKLRVSDVTTTGTVDTTRVGVYEITYSVTDSDNNTTTVIRNVAVNDESMPIYRSVAEVDAAYSNVENKDAVSCNIIHGNTELYLNCDSYNTMENAINSKNKSLVLLINDIEDAGNIRIAANNEVNFDFNGKTINGFLTSSGDLTIDDSKDGGKFVGGITINNGTLTINDGKFIDEENTDEEENNVNNIENNEETDEEEEYEEEDEEYKWNLIDILSGTATINGGTFISSTDSENYEYNAVFNRGTLTINGGTFTSKTTLSIHNGRTAIINDGLIDGIENGRDITIYGGTFMSGVYNDGAMDIIQTDKPIYMTILRNTNVQMHYDSNDNNYVNTHTLNVKAQKANACTSDPSDTTSGLCVYSENGNSLYNAKTTNINGGTFISLGNLSLDAAIFNYSGTINICNASVSGQKYDIFNFGTTTINYNNVTFSNGTTTPASGKISSKVTEASTCPIE